MPIVAAAAPGATRARVGAYFDELRAVGAGRSELAPDPKDRRFADPAWQSHTAYRRLMQAWLATQRQLDRAIAASPLDAREKGQAQFFAALVTDSLAPSNWPIGNPVALRRTVETPGNGVVRGLKNRLHDLRHNHGLPSQVDATPFKVGINVATSLGQVVQRAEMFELLQFAPTTPQVYRRPLVMSPPQINKYYAIDLAPEKSLIEMNPYLRPGTMKIAGQLRARTLRQPAAGSSSVNASRWRRFLALFVAQVRRVPRHNERAATPPARRAPECTDSRGRP